MAKLYAEMEQAGSSKGVRPAHGLVTLAQACQFSPFDTPGTEQMPVPPNYVQSLVQYAEVRGAKGLQTLLDFHDELFDRIRAEEGTAVVNSSVNGKSFGFEVTMTVEEQFGAVGEAIRELDPTDPVSGRIVCTRADFSQLIR